MTIADRIKRPDQDRYSIRDLALEFDVTPRTIRFYEDKGLIRPDRQGQTRIYRPGHRLRLEWILRGKRLGFSLEEIKELLDVYDQPNGPVRQIEQVLRQGEARIAQLTAQRDDIDTMISELEASCADLKKWLKNKE